MGPPDFGMVRMTKQKSPNPRAGNRATAMSSHVSLHSLLDRTATQIPILGDIAEAKRLWRARRATGYVMESSPGHFGSPIPSLNEVKEREHEIFSVPRSIRAVEVNDQPQLDLIRQFADLYRDQPFSRHPQEGFRYHFENSLFSYGDALMLHCVLRRYRPGRLIEVGSGFSSAVILDTNDRFLNGKLSCTFIDPFPHRLRSLLREGDDLRYRIIRQPVQNVSLEVFDELDDGDVLFIDSTHVSKIGSDVNRLLFDVLPRLKPGVLVHFHDIFYPFEYPREWIYRGRAWNENYLLRAFLMFNSDFEVLVFNSYLAHLHAAEVAASMPLWAEKPGGSLWLRRASSAV